MYKIKNKVMLILLSLILVLNLMPILKVTKAYAQVDEKEVQREEKQFKIDEIKEKEIRFPNKLTPKEPANEVDKDKNTNTGLPTPEHNAKATLIENVDNTNSSYPIHHKGDVTGETYDKYSADARQFISFKTKNGKTFHLIINHDEKQENVILLTEVSEDDLLNITGVEKPKQIVKEEPKTQELPKEEPKPEVTEEKSEAGTYIFVGLLVAGAIGAGYYFKVYKKKQKETEEDEEIYDELEDDYEAEEISKSDEGIDMDEMAIENYDEDENEETEEHSENMEEIAIDSYDEEDE